ncbi:DoxX family protein [Streptomyces sp. NPDC048179]|uniref:DoxX family protein n=1 Tax=Streptomyces sp. NPDC048179 TaxID=3365506 RepID=UPI003717F760
MSAAYWAVAALLALFYLYGGGMKVVRSRERLLPMMAWVADTPMPAVRAIGVVEVLGAVGLVLPRLAGVASWPGVAAAVGFVVLQAGAIRVHLRMGDRRIALNIVLFLTAGAAVWLAAVS